MADFLGVVLRKDVVDAKSFANYCQQTLGVPYPTIKDMMIAKRALKEFFGRYPQADFTSMCRIVDWCKAKKRRPASLAAVVYSYRYAWSDGYLSELDPKEPNDPKLEERIETALRIESDETWRHRLENSTGVKARAEVFEAWWQLRRPVFLARVK